MAYAMAYPFPQRPAGLATICVAAALCVVFASGAVADILCPTVVTNGMLKGVVTFHHPSEPYVFMLDDEGAAWRVEGESAAAVSAIKPGMRVRASGEFPKFATTPRMNHAVIKTLPGRPSALPHPIEMTTDEMHQIGEDGEDGRRPWYGRNVAVSGKVRDINRRETYTQMLIGPKGAAVIVSLPIPFGTPLPDGLAIDAHIRAVGVGVYSAERDAKTNTVLPVTDICVRLDSPADLKVTERRPFWTPVRIWGLAGAILFVLAGLALWIAMLRRTVARAVARIEVAVRQRTAAEATMRERLRLSHDLHDDFQQLLASSSFSLAAVTMAVADGAPKDEILAGLADVEASLQHTQTGLRAALWSISEESEGPSKFSDLVRYAAGRLAHWAGVVEFSFEGEEPPMARRLGGTLLMVLQEAIANAIRHGGAAKVRVACTFDAGKIRLEIADDGCGFDAADAAVFAPGHMGLKGMKDRIAELGGIFSIDASPGRGTTLRITVPIYLKR